VKRAVREWFRQAGLASGIDLVVIARQAVAALPARRIALELDRLVPPLSVAVHGEGSRRRP
jgi:RNase P protein component